MSDTKLIRKALADAKFTRHITNSLIFNDKGKKGRRLKIWDAAEVFSASQPKQRKLEALFKQAFGDRIVSMYFVKGAYWAGPNGKALCIKLKN